MISYTKLFVAGCLLTLAGCVRHPHCTICNRAFFTTGKESSGISGRKIASESELQGYLSQYEHGPLRRHLTSLTNMTFVTSFIYVTTDSELIEIRSLCGVSVHAAILKPSVQPGVGVYVVKGDPQVAIKPTDQ
ncbi:MAG: hypothetical protein ACOX5G_12685 [Kiritimatiellia bacterium]|jgi:hypothetical protein